MRDEFLDLLTPANLALTAGVLALWAGLHAFGIGEVIDAVLLVAGGLFLGASVFNAAGDLVQFVHTGAGAKTEAALDEAARHLAKFVTVVGVATFVVIIMKVGGKSVPRKLSGPVEGEASEIGLGRGAEGKGHWWEASEFGPDYPGTTVPQSFKLKVAGREYVIKGALDPVRGPRGGTKHMAEYASKYGTTRTRAGQVDFPISSLAGALEQVEKSGDLGPLLGGQVKRLGTEEAPYVKGGWELSFDYVDGKVEVLHAVPKRK